MTVTELIHTLIALPEEDHQSQVVMFDSDHCDYVKVVAVKLLHSGDISICEEE